MAGVFSIMSDAAAGMYKLRQASRPWDDDGKSSTLQEKAENGAQAFSLDPEFVRGAQAAKTAMEEAIRIGGPKGAAEDRMAKAEKRLKEIRQEARMAAARGDREKLMQLAREAALLARDAGRAAKDYASGVAAAAQMGIGGDPLRTAANGGASGVLAMSSTSIQTTTTTLQVQQVEVSVTLTIKGDGEGEGQSGTVVSGELSALTASLSAQSSDQEGGGPAATGAGQSFAPQATHPADAAEKQENGANGDDLLASLGLPSEINVDGLAERVAQGLSASGQAIGGFNGAEGKALLGAMIHDNELKASRYKEADAFARRVEAALNDAKSVIGEAKAANSGDQDVRRRGGRRKALDEMDKEVHAGFEAAADLRSAAFGSGAGLTMVTADAAAPVAAPVAVAAPAVNITA